VIFDCEATVSEDAALLAAQQTRLLARYQPEGGFRPLAPDDPLYRGAIAHIAAVRLDVRGRRVKFKLGQNRSAAVRATIVERLRERGRPSDARAAAALQWTIEQEAGAPARGRAPGS
jgi:predicted FMN-binding regulatory protein PaiB